MVFGLENGLGKLYNTSMNKDIQVIEAPIAVKPEEEQFIQLYLGGMPALRAFALAKSIDLTKEGAYIKCAAGSTRWLKRAKICKRMHQLMTLAGFTDEGADKELNFMMHQHHDLRTKLGAVKEYNALKKRTDKGKNIFKGNTFNLAQVIQKANE